MSRRSRGYRDRGCGRSGVAVLGRNGKYQINNETADDIWNQSILPISYGRPDVGETFYLLDHNNPTIILTDDGGIKLTWQ